MNKNFLKLMSLSCVLFLSSCGGYSLKEIYQGDIYVSSDFQNNYYDIWESLDDNNVVNELGEIALNKSVNKVFTSYDDDNFKLYNDSNAYNSLVYSDRVSIDADHPFEYKDSFGLHDGNNLSSIDSSFKYGIFSKLTDGKMFCNGRYELARVQIRNSNNGEGKKGGFAHLFEKELANYSYFVLNFKASKDYKSTDIRIIQHNSPITLKIGFYFKSDDSSKYKYDRQVYTYTFGEYDDVNSSWKGGVPTNPYESNSNNCYTFFGFNLDGIDVSGCCGVSIEYDLLSTPNEYASLTHSLLLYELSFPHSTWH